MLELTKDNFKEEVLEAEGYILVDYFGDGCVPVSYTHLLPFLRFRRCNRISGRFR